MNAVSKEEMEALTEQQKAVRRAVNNDVLDRLVEKLDLKNDAALARAMEVAPPVISKMRHARLAFGDVCIIKAHELTDWPVREIKHWLGQKCLKSQAVVKG